MIESKLSDEEFKRLEAEIERLRDQTGADAEHTLEKILEPLLRQEGFALEHRSGRNDDGIDFQAKRTSQDAHTSSTETLGVEAKFFQNKKHYVPLTSVRALIETALARNIDRAILVSNVEFSKQTQDEVARNLPVKIELIGISGLKNWAARLRSLETEVEAEVRVILRDVSQKLAHLIAKDKSFLAHLEWRDVERVIAEVFGGLGFGVTLTPSSKDGGKDVILTCTVKGRRAEYYVEIKHWRSSTRVGAAAVKKLLSIVVKEKKEGGLFLSTYGFTHNAFEQLTTIEKQKLRFGTQEKIVTLCRTYVKAQAGLWSPPKELSEVLWEK